MVEQTRRLNDERPIGKKRATKDKEKRDIVESIAKNVLSEFITDQKEISDKAKSAARSETVEIVKLLTEQKNKIFHDVPS
jgi:predicted component of type VI protein secretion system